MDALNIAHIRVMGISGLGFVLFFVSILVSGRAALPLRVFTLSFTMFAVAGVFAIRSSRASVMCLKSSAETTQKRMNRTIRRLTLESE